MIALVVTSVISAILGLFATKPFEGSQLEATKIGFFQPFIYTNDGYRLNPKFKVIEYLTGQCRTPPSSEGSPDPDAGRCFAGDLILDPCWTSPSLAYAICPQYPWENSVRVVRFTEIPWNPPSPDSTAGVQSPGDSSSMLDEARESWGVEIDRKYHGSNIRCFREQGASDNFIAGVRVGYRCIDPKHPDVAIGYVYGKLEKGSGDIWFCFYGHPGDSRTDQVDVVNIWI